MVKIKSVLVCLHFLLIGCLYLNSNYGFSQEVSVEEVYKEMKTYPFSDPSPIPKVGRIYPYFRFDGYTDEAIQKKWKFVELQNEFIKVSITPQIGGKIWGAIDKTSNFPFIYYNNVVKFRDVAMRGAWTSGGIELNFGDIGHDPTVSNPVDYFTRKNNDGSVSCFLASYDWASRTRWLVEVNLPKNKAFFTTKSTWYNSSLLDQTNYHWMNAGFKAAGDLEFIFPGSHYIGHAGELDTWPKNKEGKDINFYEKNNFGTYKSYHVLGKTDDFFGGYWHKDKMGFIHYSPYHEKLGKKVWIWGLSRQGMIWENLLTDNDGQYVELQSGRLFNQAAEESANSPFKHLDFKPNASDTWTEYWYPIKNIEGVTKADSWGAWKIQQKEKNLKLWISAAQNISDTLIYISGGNINKKFINILALQTFSDSLKIDDPENLKIFLGTNILLDSSEPSKDIERPLETPKDFDWSTEFGQFMKAKGLANQRKYAEAEALFLKILKGNKYHLPTLGEIAQISYRKGLYHQAIDYAKIALSINTYDPLANYILGIASYQLGDLTASKDAFSVATLTPYYKYSAMVGLSQIAIRQHDLNKAEAILSQTILENPKNENAQHLMLAVLRIKGKKKEALNLIENLNELNPLDHLVRAERYLLFPNEENKNSFLSLITNELPHENFIEMAIWYKEINDHQAASQVIALAPDTPMVNFWKYNITKDESHLKFALSMSPSLVFPFRHEELSLFEEILKIPQYSLNWKVNYYYGTLLWQLNRISEAQNHYLKCEGLPDFAPFYLAKAELFSKNEVIAKSALEKAYQLEPNNWRIVKALAEYYISKKQFEKALNINQIYKRNASHEIYILGQQKAEILLDLGRYLECLDFLKTLKMLPSEGAKGTHDLFRKANISFAIELIKAKKNSDAIVYLNEAETWPENLGSGEPYNPDNRLSSALKSYCGSGQKTVLNQLKGKLNEADDQLLRTFLDK